MALARIAFLGCFCREIDIRRSVSVACHSGVHCCVDPQEGGSEPDRAPQTRGQSWTVNQADRWHGNRRPSAATKYMTDFTDDPDSTITLSREAIDRMARIEWAAWQAHKVLPRPEKSIWPNTLADGYAIQDALVRISGLHAVGWKIGATNHAAQEHLSLSGPLSGRLFAPFRHDSPAVIDSRTSAIRALEPEIAFRIGRDMPKRDQPYAITDVTKAIAWAQPALEIPDTRWQNWEGLGAPAFVADNAAAGFIVLGAEVEDWRDLNLARMEARLVINGETVETGSGANVMKGPLSVVVWLANHLIDRGHHLRAGDLVTTGTCTPIGFAARGDEVVADFGTFGQAIARFE